MSFKDGVMIYTLQKPIKYTKSGEQVEAMHIEFHEFTAVHGRQYMKLKQMVDKAIFSVQKFAEQRPLDTSGSEVKPFNQQDVETHEKEADDLSELLNVAFSVNDDDESLFKFTDAFKAMLFRSKDHPIAVLDSANNLLETHWDKMHPEDKISCAVKYAAFFGIGLLGAMKNESETASKPHTEAKEL